MKKIKKDNLKLKCFKLDYDKYYQGYDFEIDGWKSPLFNYDVAEELMNDINILLADDGELSYIEDRDIFCFYYHDGVVNDYVEYNTYLLDGKSLYSIGGGYFQFMSITEK